MSEIKNVFETSRIKNNQKIELRLEEHYHRYQWNAGFTFWKGVTKTDEGVHELMFGDEDAAISWYNGRELQD